VPGDMALQGYSKPRMAAIILLLGLNGAFALVNVANRRFPLGVGPVLCLLPCFLREWDLKSGRAPRRLGRMEWCYVLGGVLWVVSWPLLAR
jgi:hypothetical protein